MTRVIKGSFSEDLRSLVADQIHQKAYVADYANQRLLVLDGATLEISTIALPGPSSLVPLL